MQSLHELKSLTKQTVPDFQPPFFVSGKLDFELSYHTIFSKKFEDERFVNRKYKGQQNYS